MHPLFSKSMMWCLTCSARGSLQTRWSISKQFSGMECTWLSPNTLINIKTIFRNGVHMALSKHAYQYQNNFQEWSARGSLQTRLPISKHFSVMSQDRMECTWLTPNTLINIKTIFRNGVHMALSKHAYKYQNNFQ